MTAMSSSACNELAAHRCLSHSAAIGLALLTPLHSCATYASCAVHSCRGGIISCHTMVAQGSLLMSTLLLHACMCLMTHHLAHSWVCIAWNAAWFAANTRALPGGTHPGVPALPAGALRRVVRTTGVHTGVARPGHTEHSLCWCH